MTGPTSSHALLELIVNRVNIGIVVVDRQLTITRWNGFMAMHSGIDAEQAVGSELFALFPELPKRWLEQKLRSVFLLKTYAFTSWEQRPYLFRFPHNRPVTASRVECMRQNCTFIPIKNARDEVTHVCITVMDVTDACIYQLQLQEAMERLERMSERDPLTGIFNRGHIESRLASEFARSRRHGTALSVIMFDIDHFKRVNDTWGHLAGDEVLREVTQRVLAELRSDDIFGRYGGEEFTVVLPNTDLRCATVAAERLRQRISDEPVQTSAGAVPITATLGVATLSDAMPNHEALLDAADKVLYQGKKAGRNRVSPADIAA